MDFDRYNQLDALGRSGKPDEAIRGLREMERTCDDPEDRALVLLAISDCFVLLDRYTDARQAIERALALVGKHNEYNARIAFKDAYIDIYLRDWKKALSKIDSILKNFRDLLLLADNADLLQLLETARGIVLVELHRYGEAVPLLEQAAAAKPNDGVTLIYLAASYFAVKELKKSKECYVKALTLELDSSYRSNAHYFLGRIYYSEENFAWAKQEFEKSLNQVEPGAFTGPHVFQYLKLASQALGLDAEVERYSQLIRQKAAPRNNEK
jgi:tetratricopeptide (TPR) repeat protein